MTTNDETDGFTAKKVLLLILIGLFNSIVAINHTLPTFHGYTPHFHCQVDNVSATVEGCVKPITLPVEDQGQSCPQGYIFQSDTDDSTIVTEWQLVCEHHFLAPLSATLYFCGVTIGAIVCGLLADRWGRRTVGITCLYIQGIVGVALYFTRSLEAYMALRFIQGFFLQGLQGSAFTLMIEMFPPKSRTAVAVVFEMSWSVGMMYLAGAAYAIPQWRPLQLLLSVPTAATLLYVCVIPESPRWLATHAEKKSSFCQFMSNNKKTDEEFSEAVQGIYIFNDTRHYIKNEVNDIDQENTYRNLQDIETSESKYSMYNNAFEDCSKEEEKTTHDPPSNSADVTVHNVDDEVQEICTSDSACNLPSNSESDGEKNVNSEAVSKEIEDLNCLWKEIIKELGYDVEKALLRELELSSGTKQNEDSDDRTLDQTRDSGCSSDVESVIENRLSRQMNNVSPDTRGKRTALNNSTEQKLKAENVTNKNDDSMSKRNTINSIKKSSVTSEVKRARVLDIFRNKILRKFNLVMVFVWFSVALSYYGIIFHLPGLSGERHLNFFLGAVTEVISFVILYFILSRIGRRLPMATFILVTSVMCLTVSAISVVPKEDVPWIGNLQTVLALLGKSTAICAFCTMFLYASELFPTVLRAAAMGHCGFWARVGSLLAPQILLLGDYTLPAVPLVIMGVLAMLAGACVFALPETLGQELPDTIEQAEMLVKTKTKAPKKIFYIEQ